MNPYALHGRGLTRIRNRGDAYYVIEENHCHSGKSQPKSPVRAKQWEVATAARLTTVSASSGSSEGPGLAIEFGLAVLRALAGEDVYLKVKAGMLL